MGNNVYKVAGQSFTSETEAVLYAVEHSEFQVSFAGLGSEPWVLETYGDHEEIERFKTIEDMIDCPQLKIRKVSEIGVWVANKWTCQPRDMQIFLRCLKRMSEVRIPWKDGKGGFLGKIEAIKMLRQVADFSLVEAKELVEELMTTHEEDL